MDRIELGFCQQYEPCFSLPLLVSINNKVTLTPIRLYEVSDLLSNKTPPSSDDSVPDLASMNVPNHRKACCGPPFSFPGQIYLSYDVLYAGKLHMPHNAQNDTPYFSSLLPQNQCGTINLHIHSPPNHRLKKSRLASGWSKGTM